MELIMKQGGRVKSQSKRKKQSGGYLHGPSHEGGGIPARIRGGGMVELEGGEIIINAETVKKLGEDFFLKLNATASPYHSSTQGFKQGELQVNNQSIFRTGGYINNGKRYKNGGYVFDETLIDDTNYNLNSPGFTSVRFWARPVNRISWNTYVGKWRHWRDRHRDKVLKSIVPISLTWKIPELDQD